MLIAAVLGSNVWTTDLEGRWAPTHSTRRFVLGRFTDRALDENVITDPFVRHDWFLSLKGQPKV
jgi:hypothetical protein